MPCEIKQFIWPPAWRPLLIYSTHDLPYTKDKEVKLRFSAVFESNPILLKDFVRMAMPAVLNDASWGLAFSMYSVVIGQFLGTDVVAANSFASLARSFGSVLATGVASAGGTLLGRMIGENRLEYADGALSAIRLICGFMQYR